jgi:hypothetical protein
MVLRDHIQGFTQIRSGVVFVALRSTLLCALVAGCANGWPSAHHSKPTSAQVAHTCKTSASRIVRSDCSTITPANQVTGDDWDQDRQQHQNGTAHGGITSPQ